MMKPMTGGEELGSLGIVGKMSVALEYSTLHTVRKLFLLIKAFTPQLCPPARPEPLVPHELPARNHTLQNRKKNYNQKMLPAAAFPA